METLDQAAAAIQTALPAADINTMGDTGIEVCLGNALVDAFIIEESSDGEGWDTREGWGDSIFPEVIHFSDIAATVDTLEEAAQRAIDYLRTPEH